MDHCPCPHRRSSGLRRLHSYTPLTIAYRHFSFARHHADGTKDGPDAAIHAARKSPRLEAAQHLLKRSGLLGPAIVQPEQRRKSADCVQKALSSESTVTVPTLRRLRCRLTAAPTVLVCLWCPTSWAPHIRVRCRCGGCHFSFLKLTGSLKTSVSNPCASVCACRRPTRQNP